MAIRVRRRSGGARWDLVALCAAETEAEVGDLYLDDAVHHALYVKFEKDRKQESAVLAITRVPEPPSPFMASDA